MSDAPSQDDRPFWADPVEQLEVSGVPAEAATHSVDGRRLTGPLQGFGPMWEKKYGVRLEGADVTPAEVISGWKQHFGEFWPSQQSFYAPLAGIRPGEIGLFTGGMGPAQMSTGVMVVYADDESFTFMNPEGHPWAGWITFSAYEEEGATTAQVHLLVRTNDPIFEIGFRFFGGAKAEDRLWMHTLTALAAHFGVDAEPTYDIVCLDRRPQWRNLSNIRHNSLITTTLHTLGTPFRALRRSA